MSACGHHATSQEGKLRLITTTSLSTKQSQLLLLTDSISINRKHIEGTVWIYPRDNQNPSIEEGQTT